MEFLLMERKIIVISSYSNILTFACEAILALCFPFTWDHIYIPILPSRMLSYLQAPVPFLVGINREYFDTPIEQENRPSDAVLIDLDNDKITSSGRSLYLPTREKRKLISRIQKFIPTNTGNNLESMITFNQTFPNGKHVSLCSFSSRLDSLDTGIAQSQDRDDLPQLPSGKAQSPMSDLIPDYKHHHSLDTKSISSISSEPSPLNTREVYILWVIDSLPSLFQISRSIALLAFENRFHQNLSRSNLGQRISLPN